MAHEYKYLAKVILIGPSGAGKSEVLHTMTEPERKFSDDHQPTIGVEFGTRTVDVEGARIKLQIWDTAGQEDFRSITRSYYRGAQVVCVMWDASKLGPVTYYLQSWVDEVKRQAADNARIIFVACKVDEKSADLESQKAEIQTIASTWGVEGEVIILETSSKNRKEKKETGATALLNKIAELGLPLAKEAGELEVAYSGVHVVPPSEPFFLTERIGKIQHTRKPRETELAACFEKEKPTQEDVQWLLLNLDSVDEKGRTATQIRNYLTRFKIDIDHKPRPKEGLVPELLKLLDEEERAKFPKFVTLFFFASFSDKYVAERDAERKIILDVAKNIHLGRNPYEGLERNSVPKTVVDIIAKPAKEFK